MYTCICICKTHVYTYTYTNIGIKFVPNVHSFDCWQVRDQTGDEMLFKVKKATKMQKIFDVSIRTESPVYDNVYEICI
jgi:hypothetical protein